MAGFRETGEFRMQSIGPLNRTFNYADAHDSPGAAPQMFWFARAFSRPTMRNMSAGILAIAPESSIYSGRPDCLLLFQTAR